MYTIGCIDDDEFLVKGYSARLGRYKITLLYPDNCVEMKDILDWILLNNIRCLMVDFQLHHKFEFHGTDLVSFINVKLPDLPCVIMTGFIGDSIKTNMVVTNLIEDKKVLEDNNLDKFVIKIKQAVDVFDKRLKKHTDEYMELLDKKRQLKISAIEEERFFDLFKLLRAYGEVDDIPVELLKSEVGKTLDQLIQDTSDMIKTIKKRK